MGNSVQPEAEIDRRPGRGYYGHIHVTTERTMEKTIGIRRLRDGLTRYLGGVRRGGRVVITDRGRPVALLLPYPESGDSEGQERLKALLSGGHIMPAEKRFLANPPLIKGQGPLPSDLISEGRR